MGLESPSYMISPLIVRSNVESETENSSAVNTKLENLAAYHSPHPLPLPLLPHLSLLPSKSLVSYKVQAPKIFQSKISKTPLPILLSPHTHTIPVSGLDYCAKMIRRSRTHDLIIILFFDVPRERTMHTQIRIDDAKNQPESIRNKFSQGK